MTRRRTKIVATLGPATDDRIRAGIAAGARRLVLVETGTGSLAFSTAGAAEAFADAARRCGMAPS